MARLPLLQHAALALSLSWAVTAMALDLRSNPAFAVLSSPTPPQKLAECIMGNAQYNTLAVERKAGSSQGAYEVRVKNIVDGALTEAFLADLLPEGQGSSVRIYVDSGVLAPAKMQAVLLQGC